MQVRFEDVTLKFDDKVILDRINFTLDSHQLVSFLGPSGSGKSTTLYLISGLLEADSGRIYFDDRDVTHVDSAKRGVGLVFQNYALYPHMTVKENIMFPLKIAKMDKKEREAKAVHMAKLTRIADQLDKYPSQLSGGQQQRVAISRAMVKDPSILLMDEPLSNLDARLRIEMREEIRRIQQETGVTTVFVTHDQEEALSIADQVMVLDQGEIQQMSSPQALYRQPNNLFVARFIGNPVINVLTHENQGLNTDHPLLQQFPWRSLGIRSESFRVAEASDYLIEAVIDRIDYIGKDVTIHAQDAGGNLLTITDLVGDFTEGQTLYLNVDPDEALFFDGEDRLITGGGYHE